MTQLSSNVVAPAANAAEATPSPNPPQEAPPSPIVPDATLEDTSSSGGPPAAPAPATAPTARPGLQVTGPWIVGELYGVVPGGPLAPVPDHGEKWYAITKGRYVGVTNSTAIADGAVSRVSNALRAHYDTQREAVTAFNDALASPFALIQVV